MNRRTLGRAVEAHGVGLHSGTEIRMELQPAAAGSGITFYRRDLRVEIPALYARVGETRLGTVLVRDDARVGVIEHLMAALSGAGIDDARIELDGPEPPILDGDALCYLALIDAAGVRLQEGRRGSIHVRKVVEIRSGEASVRLHPHDGRQFEFTIDFASKLIGCQHLHFVFTEAGFRSEIAPARTFGFLSDLDALLKMGLSRGASLSNTLAIDGDRLANPQLLRFADEFVRHKILDAIGDLALAGAPIYGRFEGLRSSHALNNQLLRALFADPDNYVRAD
jgi:UDP-3-O-[3-hydroxymyristoyl] N-acetylglucosamine deacetylase